HREDVFLTVVIFELIGREPFLELKYQHAHTWHIVQQPRRLAVAGAVHVFGQLLGDGAAAPGISLYGRGDTRKNSQVVYAVMLEKSNVFRCDQRIHHILRNAVIGYRRAIFLKIAANKHTISSVHLRGDVLNGPADILRRRRITKQPQEVYLHHTHQQNNRVDADDDIAYVAVPYLLKHRVKMTICFDNAYGNMRFYATFA